MTEKDLRKLNRYQLLELLIIQTRRTEELEAQLEEKTERWVYLNDLAERIAQQNNQ